LVKNSIAQLPIIGRIKNASSEDLKRLKIENGVKISDLDATYERYWRKNGIEEGSIITAINDEKIKDIDAALEIIKNKATNEPLKFEIINKNGQKENFFWR